MNPHYQQREKKIRRNCRHKFYPQPLFIVFFNFSHKRPTFAFTSESGYTLGSAQRIAHKGLHGETGAIRMGALLLPSERSTCFVNPARPGGKTAYFAALRSWPGALSKNAESLRGNDALMRVAVPRRRGPLGCADICRKYINFPSRILLPKSKDRQEKPLSDVPHPCF